MLAPYSYNSPRKSSNKAIQTLKRIIKKLSILTEKVYNIYKLKDTRTAEQ